MKELGESRGTVLRGTVFFLIPQVVVQLTEDLLSQAVMMVENCRPTLAINLSGARQNWLEGMLRHEIGEDPQGGAMSYDHQERLFASEESLSQLHLFTV